MKLSHRKRRLLARLIGLYPPYLFSGISVKLLSKSPLRYRTTLRRRFWNQNAVGTHFGGSLYSMTDPFFMLILMDGLGEDFIVWDQASNIEYLKAVREPVSATFEIAPSTVEDLRAQAKGKTIRPVFEVEVKTASGEVVAKVKKTLYIRKKSSFPANKGT